MVMDAIECNKSIFLNLMWFLQTMDGSFSLAAFCGAFITVFIYRQMVAEKGRAARDWRKE